MPSFQYLVVNGQGERIRGELKSEGLETAIRNLQEGGNTIISLNPSVDRAGEGGGRLGERVERFVHRMRTHVPLGEVVFMTRQLSTMFSAGMTLERSLANLVSNESNPRLRKVLVTVGSDIQKGTSLSDSMSKHPGVFNNLYIALIKAGEAGGSLGTTLDRLADYLEKIEDVRRKVVSALYYPVFVLSFLFVCVCILVLKIAPMFDRVYKSFGADLPMPTQVLMGISNLLIDNFLVGFVLFLLLITGLFLFILTDRGRMLFDACKLKIPVFGTLLLHSALAGFSRTLGLLLSSSVPVLDALYLSSRTVGNVIVEKGVAKARILIQDGSSIHAAMRKTLVFPAILIQLVATGEETGELESLLLKAAAFYEKQVEALLSRLTSLIEPMLIVLMGVVVGAIVIVIYLPIFYLGLAMKRGMK